jgi:LmbE family N-acetylglucosaminyl deacetylase
MPDAVRLMVVGAHPDDAEYRSGGLAALYRGLGHDVLFVSLTDGSAGHHRVNGPALAARRWNEAAASAATLGIGADVWDVSDGRLVADLANRERLIRTIRRYRPDIVLTHRPNDYHPDHRATSQLVQDSAYLLTVPAICPDVPHLARDPVIGYLADDFTRPYPFTPSVIVDVTAAWEAKISLLHEHRSQFYEWLPYNGGYEREVPTADDVRKTWLSRRMAGISRRLADRYRSEIVAIYGVERGGDLDLIEPFEACEYGAPFDDAACARLFPFVPRPGSESDRAP